MKIIISVCFALIWFILLGFAGVVIAQESTSGYQLREPSAEEYLNIIPSVLDKWREELPAYYGKAPDQPIFYAMLDEMSLRYPNNLLFSAHYDLLLEAFNALNRAVFAANPIDDSEDWLLGMFRAWLRDTSVDMTDFENIDFPPFVSGTNAIDFDGDGVDEYTAWIDDYLNSFMIVLKRDESLPGKYLFIRTPIDRSLSFTSGDWLEPGATDLNSDGHLDWIGAYGGNWLQCTELAILTWRNNEMVEILLDEGGLCSNGIYAYRHLVEWEYLNLDDDPAVEIRQIYPFSDNWSCLQTSLRVYDWDGENYTLISDKLDNADTLGCSLRQAETLMWENRANEAIPFYEHGLQMGWDTEATSSNVDYHIELEQYARIRLALAYTLVGRINNAIPLIESLEHENQTSEMLTKLIGALAKAKPNAASLCIAAYNIFNEYEIANSTYPVDEMGITVGRLENFDLARNSTPPEAEKAGCDAPSLIDGLVQSHIFTVGTSPTQQLEALDLEVDDFITVDLNGDGQDEWLVWLTARVDPLFFAPKSHIYILSRPQIRRPNNPYTQITTYLLPSQQDSILVDWVYMDGDRTTYDLLPFGVSEVSCVTSEGDFHHFSQGSIQLWRLRNNALEFMLKSPLCEYREIDEIFQNGGRELHTWAVIYQGEREYEKKFGDSVYLWGEAQQTYMPPEPQPLIEPTFIPEIGEVRPDSELGITLMTDAYLFEAVKQARSQFKEVNYAEALAILDHAATSRDPDANPIIVNAIFYWRALTLGQLNRRDEALAQYLAIFNAAPESAWGMLAGLHLSGG